MKRRVLALLLALTVLSGGAFSQDNAVQNENQKDKKEKPPLRADKIIGELLAGGLAGYGGAYLGYDWGGGKEGELAGALVGLTAGTALGVSIAGSLGSETGSFLAALGGSCVGFLSLWAIPVNEVLILAMPTICSTIAFNLTRKYKSKHFGRTALLNFEDNKLNIDIPQIGFQPDPVNPRALCLKVDVARIAL
ncbi:MAG: hypothetical protein FJY80_14415 [Candidatus Aminicenantes bacterium]|nr:hypothetical protein [Candidatus Aminicenantes bacterium]